MDATGQDGNRLTTPEKMYRSVLCRRPVLLWIGIPLGLALFVVGWRWSAHVAGNCRDLDLAAELSGSDHRLTWVLAPCYAGTAPSGPVALWQMFFADLLVIAGYWLVGTLILWAGWWRYEAVLLRRSSWVIWLPTYLTVADLVEDGLMLVVLHNQNRRLHVRSGWVPANLDQYLLVTTSWIKWALAGATIVAVVMAAAVWFSRRDQHAPSQAADLLADQTTPVSHNGHKPADEPPTEDPARFADQRRVLDWPDPGDDRELVALRNGAEREAAAASREPPPTVGICLSGGGIRSAAFALGVLTELEKSSVENREQPATASARYLAAVSGGAWAATVWTLQKARFPSERAADSVISRLAAVAPDSGYQRQKYLMNRRGGIVPALCWMLFCTLTNLVWLASLIYVIAWPLGWFEGRCPISGRSLGEPSCGASAPMPDARLLFHPAYLLALAGGVFLLVYCGFGNRARASRWRLGAGLIALAVFSALYLVVMPQVFALMHHHISVVNTVSRSLAGASVLLGVGGTLWKVVGGPLMHQVTGRVSRAFPRLLGVVLAIIAVAWALLVMYKASTLTWAWWTPLAALAVMLLIYQFLSPNCPSLHNIYSDRLRRSFDPVAYPFPGNPENPQLRDGTWAELAAKSQPQPGASVPELVLCCSQQRNGIATGGVRAETFTVSPNWVRQGLRTTATSRYLDAAAKVKRLHRNEFGDLGQVSTWLATTGAAFSSAMGRMSLGSTNAFLAAVNANLGIWLPNLRILQEAGKDRSSQSQSQPQDDARLFPRPRLSYLIKEILGWYNVDDRFVFITDGGHWDNTGLVELLRRECDIVYCVDASGDPPGTFVTLHQALALASLELDDFHDCRVNVEQCLGDMLPPPNYPPLAIAATLTLPRAGRKPVIVHYTKLQATQDMNATLRRYAIADPKFPRYSTLRQFLSPLQFKNLVELGRFAGERLVSLSHREPAPAEPGPAPPIT